MSAWTTESLMLGLISLLAACSSNNPPERSDTPKEERSAPTPQTGGLIGTAWQLEDLGGAGVIDNSMTTLEFIEAGRVAGRGGCNRFFGSVEIAGESIEFGQMGSTRMACAEALMNQESSYLKALAGAERYTLNGDELLVYSRGLAKPLRFIRSTP